jgi:hypothetical protein
MAYLYVTGHIFFYRKFGLHVWNGLNKGILNGLVDPVVNFLNVGCQIDGGMLDCTD